MSKKSRLISTSKTNFPQALLILLSVVAVAVLINVAFAYRSPEETAPPNSNATVNAPIVDLVEMNDWEDYVDTVGKFSIKVPPDWIQEEGVYVFPSHKYWEITWRKSYEMDAPWIILGVWENPLGLSTPEWLGNRLQEQGASTNSTTYEPIEIAGTEGLVVTRFPNGGVRTILFSYNSKMYEFTLGTGSAEGGAPQKASVDDEKTFNLMMNSLQLHD